MKSNPFDDAIAAVRDRLGALGSTILYYPSIGSTNDVAMSRAFEGLVVVADEQTAGRGRRGHAWFSPPGSGLYASVVLAPARARVEPARATSLLTIAAGVAIAEAVDAATGLAVDLKWPNDLYIDHRGRRKLAGILAEASPTGSAASIVVLGYGINVGRTAYPPELADRATSLESELGRAIDRHQLFAQTLVTLSRRYRHLLDGEFDAILDAWRRRAPSSVGTRVAWTTPAGQQSGITEGIDDHGALLVRIGDRVERIVGGELTWL